MSLIELAEPKERDAFYHTAFCKRQGLKSEDSKYTKNDIKYPGKVLDSLRELQEQNQLCDITINVGGRTFHAHKAVLAACSSYFLTMFTSGFKESSQNEISIDGDAGIFESLLEFAYTGELSISPRTVCDILEMACYMQFSNIFENCADFIQICYYSRSDEDHKMTVGEALKIAILARNHDNEHIVRLAEPSVRHLGNHVAELKKSDAFLEYACVDFLEELLSYEDLSSASEEEHVLEMVLAWLKYDWGNRYIHAHQLLQKVRLGHVTAESLRKVDADILEIPECKMLFDEVLQLKSSETPKATLSRQYPELFATRSTITVPVVSEVVTIGHRRKLWKLKYYDDTQEFDSWSTLKMASLPRAAQCHSLLEVNGELYAAGGLAAVEKFCSCGFIHELALDSYDDRLRYYKEDYDSHDRVLYKLECQQKFYRYNLEENAWTELPPMNVARRSFPMVHLGGFIYAISGSRSTTEGYMLHDMDMSDVERYDMAGMKWEVLAPLLPTGSHLLKHISAAVFKGKILVYGTLEGASRILRHALYVYHPSANKWQIALWDPVGEGAVSDWYNYKPPALFVYEGVCYRIHYPKPPATNTDESGSEEIEIRAAVVNILEFKSLGADDDISVTVGQEMKQDYVRNANNIHAFRIHDEVFLDDNGCVYKTDIKIKPDQSSNVDLVFKYGYSHCTGFNEISNITYFTFDRKLLAN